MKGENKYYIPNIEEFHVGFEYEYRNEPSIKWSKSIFKDGESTELHDEYRIKYLNKEDIESLGWEFSRVLHNSTNTSVFSKGGKYLDYDHTTHELVIHNDLEYEDFTSWFIGIIKNKSELKMILKMIGV